MPNPREIISSIHHRPWPLPSGPWMFYQEWNRALFFHWRVPKKLLLPLIPKGTSLETFDGDAWISIVAFTMEKIRPRFFPSWRFVSTFYEINVRTYVTSEDKAGVYFLNIEAGKRISVLTSKLLSGLPYEYANIERNREQNEHRYSSINKTKGFQLQAIFGIGEQIQTKSPPEIFLTEKYCLYLDKADRLYRFDVHHLPWNLHHLTIMDLKTSYQVGGISLDRSPDLMHYSEGVQVLGWKRQRVP